MEESDMNPMTGRRLSPGTLLRPRRVRRLARNALVFYILSRPLRRAINPRRASLRRKYAPPRSLQVLGWLLGGRRAH
jgi:hypothetical protein